jgi:ATP-dependent Clp endopeptidase proteolytic subunit ClpP
MIKNTDVEPTDEETAEQAALIMAAMQGEEEPDRAALGLLGDIDEETSQEILQGLIHLNGGKVFPNPLEEDEEAEADIEFLICTGGGAVHEMFALHDMMTIVKERRDIATLGMGKVFSAGVPLLINGTPGKRCLTKNTRVMLHRCNGGNMGTTADMQSSHDEMRVVEDRMIDLIADHTDLTPAAIREIFSTNTDTFFSAEQALEMGLVDKII